MRNKLPRKAGVYAAREYLHKHGKYNCGSSDLLAETYIDRQEYYKEIVAESRIEEWKTKMRLYGNNH